jgi:branched-chain amino acid transport system permease protein
MLLSGLPALSEPSRRGPGRNREGGRLFAGFVALVAGMMWGARNGVQFALTFTALKALPVLILGGFTSVPGAIVGGLIIGASEKLAEIYIPPVMQDLFGGNFGGIEGWFPYVLALLFLLVRPEGLFGEKHIDRV